jgi:hypothetical protein
MRTQGSKLGPVGERVQRNVKQLRGRIPVRELSKRLTELGRPILPSGITAIEQGTRRVDTDDLVALALALNVTPNRLLLDPEADDASTWLTPDYYTDRVQAWAWACGEVAWGVKDASLPSSLFGGVPIYVFQATNRPHNVPVLLAAEEWRELEPWQRKLDELRDEMEAAGADFRALVPDRVTFEEK